MTVKKDKNHPEVTQTYSLFAAQKKIRKNLNEPENNLLIKTNLPYENSIFL